VDWWSLGTLLYEMMAGLPPFYDTNVEVMYEKILTAELRFPRHFLPETRSLLTGMLTRQVDRRLGYRGAGGCRLIERAIGPCSARSYGFRAL
jgi:serum/glucocorticoid-regulated kinase 2